MGLLTDFVISESGTGPAIAVNLNPSEAWSTLQAKQVDTVKIANLYCIVTQQPYHNDVQERFTLVGGDQESGPWVFEFPSDILNTFSSIDPESIDRLALTWSRTEEAIADRWTTEDAAIGIRKLSEHCRKATDSGRSMFLWVCL